MGLSESGKTTLLEAIFLFGKALALALSNDPVSVFLKSDVFDGISKNQYGFFTGKIKVDAQFILSEKMDIPHVFLPMVHFP
ncbi:hypothetical protein [Candidatus Liberibacter asiaticus]|uniref:hypothetical protein n=1 Tax=Liberibacter asiaticus TaxID=34021 RepID=UPI001926E31B|nr:hypothetical protein [Candidatus Liberibacter asiaticus]